MFSRYFRFLINISGYFGFLINISRYFRSLIDVGGYLVLVKFDGIVRLIKSSRFLRYGVDISRNLRLSGFLKY